MFNNPDLSVDYFTIKEIIEYTQQGLKSKINVDLPVTVHLSISQNWLDLDIDTTHLEDDSEFLYELEEFKLKYGIERQQDYFVFLKLLELDLECNCTFEVLVTDLNGVYVVKINNNKG